MKTWSNGEAQRCSKGFSVIVFRWRTAPGKKKFSSHAGSWLLMLKQGLVCWQVISCMTLPSPALWLPMRYSSFPPKAHSHHTQPQRGSSHSCLERHFTGYCRKVTLATNPTHFSSKLGWTLLTQLPAVKEALTVTASDVQGFGSRYQPSVSGTNNPALSSATAQRAFPGCMQAAQMSSIKICFRASTEYIKKKMSFTQLDLTSSSQTKILKNGLEWLCEL